jgi:hypothetical protein
MRVHACFKQIQSGFPMPHDKSPPRRLSKAGAQPVFSRCTFAEMFDILIRCLEKRSDEHKGERN